MNDLAYRQRHLRVVAARGKAADLPCITACGSQAIDWATIHGRDGESADDYQPMCRRCHARYDEAVRPPPPSWKGRTHTDESRRKMSASHTGLHRPTCNAGHERTPENSRKRPDLIDAVHDATRDASRTGIPAGPGGMARTLLYDIDADDSVVFWDSLAGYSTDGPGDPRAVLLFTIRQMREAGQLRRPGESIGLIFTAWNAWRDHQKITSLAVRDSKGRPLRIPTPV